MKRSNEQLSVDVRLKTYIDASGNCEDRKAFYKALKTDGPLVAYQIYSRRVGINPLWLPQIREILGVENEIREQR